MVSGVGCSDSSFTYNTQCSSQQVPSLMSLTPSAHPPTRHLISTPQFVLCISESLMVCLPLCLYLIFPSLPYVHLLCFLNSTYEWNHTVFVFLSLILFSIIHSGSIHIVANGKISSFWSLSSIPLYICIYTTLSIHQSRDIWTLSIIWLYFLLVPQSIQFRREIP